MERKARPLHGGVREEQGHLQGALGGSGDEMQSRALHEGGGEEQRRLLGDMVGG